jgi:hypothetical protein
VDPSLAFETTRRHRVRLGSEKIRDKPVADTPVVVSIGCLPEVELHFCVCVGQLVRASEFEPSQGVVLCVCGTLVRDDDIRPSQGLAEMQASLCRESPRTGHCTRFE